MKKLLPILLILIGTGAGVGAGVFLRPAPVEMHEEMAEEHDTEKAHEAEEEETNLHYVKMSNQFVVPVVNEAEVSALVVLALSLEVPEGHEDSVRLREPKLRDSFLRVLFDHANIGGFDGAFTEATNLETIRSALREAAQKDMGEEVITDVLINEIARQDY